MEQYNSLVLVKQITLVSMGTCQQYQEGMACADLCSERQEKKI